MWWLIHQVAEYLGIYVGPIGSIIWRRLIVDCVTPRSLGSCYGTTDAVEPRVSAEAMQKHGLFLPQVPPVTCDWGPEMRLQLLETRSNCRGLGSHATQDREQ